MIRAATPADVPVIHAMVRELATYEKVPHEVLATEEQLAEGLFGPEPAVFAHVAVAGGGAGGGGAGGGAGGGGGGGGTG
ncbi:hypothetical protein OK074_9012, partial [Actinobacteria bacterium OK074]